MGQKISVLQWPSYWKLVACIKKEKFTYTKHIEMFWMEEWVTFQELSTHLEAAQSYNSLHTSDIKQFCTQSYTEKVYNIHSHKVLNIFRWLN